MTIQKLRKELTQVDDQLLELIAKRQEIISQIGIQKRQKGQQLRDYSREKQVIQNARNRAAALGVSPETAQTIFERLIDSSLARQEQEKMLASGQGNGKSALIIGGCGKIGGWFANFLSSQGFDVFIGDPAVSKETPTQKKDWESFKLNQDIIVVAAPLGGSAQVLYQLADKKPKGLIFDVASLKGPVKKALAAVKAAQCKVTSLHPMFGPDTEMLCGRHVIFLDTGDPQALEEAKALFEPTMVKQVDMTLDEHDKLIAYVLGLSHILNIAFFTALANSGENAARLNEMSSTSFDAQLNVAKKISAENPYLYYEIQRLNEYRNPPRKALVDALNSIIEVIETDDTEGFVKIMETGRAYLKTLHSNS